MKVWVDADACPVVIRDILIKAALNRKVEMEFVANHFYQLPNSPYLNWRRVPQGADQADQEIVDRVCAGDLVIATDLPLANDLIDRIKRAEVNAHWWCMMQEADQKDPAQACTKRKPLPKRITKGLSSEK